MPELLNVYFGIVAISLGSLLLGLLVWIRVLVEKFAPLWLWLFSLGVIVGGVYSIITSI